jgi:hypothetical protein
MLAKAAACDVRGHSSHVLGGAWQRTGVCHAERGRTRRADRAAIFGGGVGRTLYAASPPLAGVLTRLLGPPIRTGGVIPDQCGVPARRRGEEPFICDPYTVYACSSSAAGSFFPKAVCVSAMRDAYDTTLAGGGGRCVDTRCCCLRIDVYAADATSTPASPIARPWQAEQRFPLSRNHSKRPKERTLPRLRLT